MLETAHLLKTSETRAVPESMATHQYSLFASAAIVVHSNMTVVAYPSYSLDLSPHKLFLFPRIKCRHGNIISRMSQEFCNNC
jgi:hypothetical protein